MIPLLVFLGVLFVYGLASRRLERTVVTAPMVFTMAGMLMFPSLAGILRAGLGGEQAIDCVHPAVLGADVDG